jgi:hypothetical protein
VSAILSIMQKAQEVIVESSVASLGQRGVGGICTRILVLGNWRAVFAAISLLFVLACTTTAPGQEPPTPTVLTLGGPDYSVILVTSDLAVGTNRVSFGLIDRDGMPVRTAQAQVQSVYLPPGQDGGEIRQTATAQFQQWPPGERGVYVTTLDFDLPGEATEANPGFWGLQVTTTTEAGVVVEAQTAARVAEQSSTPGIGDPAPRSVTPTVRDTDDLSTISSSEIPDPDLYQLSVDQALDSDKPLVVVFASPAFCVSATCGPQVNLVGQVKERHQNEANFIHVEVFVNPHLIEEGRPTGGWSPVIDEWGMLSEPWTFVIDSKGLVRAKFEQFTPAEEIEAALLEIL